MTLEVTIMSENATTFVRLYLINLLLLSRSEGVFWFLISVYLVTLVKTTK